MNHDPERRPLMAMAAPIVACVVVVMALGVGKLTGVLDPLVARRGVGVMFGLTGNFVPKLRLFQPAVVAAPSAALDRFAGWLFVLCGLSVAMVFLCAPADMLFVLAPAIVFGGFLAVLIRWLRWEKKQLRPLSRPMTPGRVTLATMLATVVWVSAIFLADALWGDHVSRWMAIVFPLVLIWLSAVRARSDAARN